MSEKLLTNMNSNSLQTALFWHIRKKYKFVIKVMKGKNQWI